MMSIAYRSLRRVVLCPVCVILLIPVLLGRAQSAPGGDAANGKLVFARSCALCHSVEDAQSKIGPSLFGVGGRMAGTAPGYAFSPAMKAFGKPWDADVLSAFLAAPRTVVPGTKMNFVGLSDAGLCQDVAAYLATLR